MTRAAELATRFVHLLAHVEPSPGNDMDRRIINTARRLARTLEAEGIRQPDDLPGTPLPVSAAGVPITKRKA